MLTTRFWFAMGSIWMKTYISITTSGANWFNYGQAITTKLGVMLITKILISTLPNKVQMAHSQI